MIAASPRRTAVFLSLSAGALAAACSVQPGPGESDTEQSETRDQGVSHGPSEPRMRSDVYHPSVHVFTTGWPAGDVTRAARKVKELVLGSAEGSRTKSTDITGAAAAWPHDTGLTLFSLNVGGPTDGCYALADPGNVDAVYPDARAEARGLWDLIKTVTGASSPRPC